MNILKDIMYPAERVPTRPITLPFVKWVREWLESSVRHYGWTTTMHNKELLRLYELSLHELVEEMREVNRTREQNEAN